MEVLLSAFSDFVANRTFHYSFETFWFRGAIHRDGEKAWIANTTSSIELIEQLVEERKKFRNSRGTKIVTPKPEFYELYNQQQIFDLTSSLDIYHEIPLDYAYFDDGARERIWTSMSFLASS